MEIIETNTSQVESLQGTPWTREQDLMLVYLIGRGETPGYVHLVMQRSVKAVQARHVLLTQGIEVFESTTGWTVNKRHGERWTTAEEHELVTRRDQGMDWQEISRLHGRSARAVEMQYVKTTEGSDSAHYRELVGEAHKPMPDPKPKVESKPKSTRSFPAKFAGKCQKCGGRIQTGTLCLFISKGKIAHATCQ